MKHESHEGHETKIAESGQPEDQVISLDFKTGRRNPPVAPGKVVELKAVDEGTKIVPVDANGNPVPEPFTLKPFPDGYVFKFAANPVQPGRSFVVYDVDETVIAVCQRFEYADLICNAVRMLFMAAVEHQNRAQQTGAPVNRNRD